MNRLIFDELFEFRSPTSDDMDRWKGRGEGRRKKIREEKGKKKRWPRSAKMVVAKHCVFPMICGSGGSKGRLGKAAGAEPCGQMTDEKLHTVAARSTGRTMFGALLEVDMLKKCTPLSRDAHLGAI